MTIKGKVKSIIEEMGFKVVGNEFIGDFIEGNCGDLISILVKESSDDCGMELLEFHAFNAEGDFLGKQTLDQMITNFEMNLEPVKKPNAKFVTTYNLKIQVPFDMSKMTEEEYVKYITDCDCSNALGVAELAGREELGKFLKYCPFNVIEFDPCGTEEVK